MPRLQAGGELPADAVYVERKADRELLAALMDAQFCYVLAPRQIGKSSLGNRTRRKLQDLGIAAAFVDLSATGKPDEPIWYRALGREISEQLEIANFSGFWESNEGQAPVQRLRSFLKDIVLAKLQQPVVLFVDEIEHVRTLNFSTDSFFELIRSLYNERARVAALSRLTFCLMGVSLPSELISNAILTPFNIGTSISLEDFSLNEMRTLEPELRDIGGDPSGLLGQIFEWTDGHPYMSLKICEALKRQTENSDTEPEVRVARIVAEKFLRRGRVEDLNLGWAEIKYAASDISVRRLYQRLLDGEPVIARGQDPVQMMLRLTGLAAERSRPDDSQTTHLCVRNRIFKQVFDQKWYQDKESELLIIKPYQEWLDRGKPPDTYLLGGKALEQALEWFRASPQQKKEHREYLLASLRAHRNQEWALLLQLPTSPAGSALTALSRKMIDREAELQEMLWDATTAAREERYAVRTGGQRQELQEELALLRHRVLELEEKNVLNEWGLKEVGRQGMELAESQEVRRKLAEEITRLLVAVSNRQADLEQSRAVIRSHEKAEAELRVKVDELTSSYRQVRDQYLKMEDLLDKRQQALDTTVKELSEAKQYHEEAISRCNQLTAEYRILESKQRILVEEKAILQRQNRDNRTAEQQRLGEAQQRLQWLEQDRADLRDQLAELRQQNVSIKERNIRDSKEEQLKAKLASLTQQFDEMRSGSMRIHDECVQVLRTLQNSYLMSDSHVRGQFEELMGYLRDLSTLAKE